LQNRRRRLAVEIDFSVGDIGQHENLVLLREQHQVLIKVERGDSRRRVGRIADDDRDRLRNRVLDRALERDEKFRPRLGRHGAYYAACHQEAEGVDRIGGGGDQYAIARRGDCLGHVGEAFLRSEGGAYLRLWFELAPQPG